MKLLDNLGAVVSDQRLRNELPATFAKLGLKIGLNFAAGVKGTKREVRRLVGGVMVFGDGELPVRLHGRDRIGGPEEGDTGVTVPGV